MGNQRDTFVELRGHMDGKDPFMTGGHQIVKIRTVQKTIPQWTKNDAKIREILLRSFPYLASNLKQRAKAARWVRAIHLYFRMGLTRGQLAEELGETLEDGTLIPMKRETVKSLIRTLRRVGSGRRADGTGMLGKPKGRPKKACPH